MPQLKKLWPFGRKTPETTRDVGFSHEKGVALWLEKKGYTIETMNFANKLGEIDIIARKENFIVFAEVRYRAYTDYGLAQETVTPAKQRRIAKAALSYLKMKKISGLDVRFDVIAVGFNNDIDHIESAFVPRGYWY
jgi:putative endonuclease